MAEKNLAARAGAQHPEEWRADLNPQAVAPNAQTSGRTAYDVKEAHRMLEGITNDGLKMIPVLDPGTRLEQGHTYIDLHDPRRKEFTASGEMTASTDTWYVPKDGV